MKNEFPQRGEFPQSETHQLGICNRPEILIIQTLFQGKIEGEKNKSMIRYFNFGPNFKLRWCHA